MVMICTALALEAPGSLYRSRSSASKSSGPSHSEAAARSASAPKKARAIGRPELRPGRLQGVRDRTLARPLERLREHVAHAHEPRELPGRAGRETGVVVERLPDQLRLVEARECAERRETRAAPGRAQHRQPGGAITEVMKRPRELHQVAHDRTLRERHEIDAPDVNVSLPQRRHDRNGVGVRCDQHGHCSPGIVPPQLDDARNDGRGLTCRVVGKDP
ncbi:MAG: hypothetical protein E6K29_04970 [Gammaproteobacteria bacterium]|nr:MAG: hypothetical protein E6K29_04970 [Gammaproteobacteria bacterium]